MIILWKDGVFVGSLRNVSPSGIVLPHQKRIYSLQGGSSVLAFLGDVSAVNGIIQASSIVDMETDLPKKKYIGLLFVEDTLFHIEDGEITPLNPEQSIAIGPNCDIALGAMFSGLSAENALGVWARNTVYGTDAYEKIEMAEDRFTYSRVDVDGSSSN